MPPTLALSKPQPHPSPAASLFASDYSLSPVPPTATPTSNSASPSTPAQAVLGGISAELGLASPTVEHIAGARGSGSTLKVAAPASPERPKLGPGAGPAGGRANSGVSPFNSRAPLPVVFSSPIRQGRGSESGGGAGAGTAGVGKKVEFTPEPERVVNRKKSGGMAAKYLAHADADAGDEVDAKYGYGRGYDKGEIEGTELDDVAGELDALPVIFKQDRPVAAAAAAEMRVRQGSGATMGTMATKESSRRSSAYGDYDSCMQAGLGHETKSASYKLGTEKAYHHLQRANDYFVHALGHRPLYPKAMLARSKVLIQLAMNYQPPKVAGVSLKEAVKLLRQLCAIAPKSISARETLAQACALLSSTLIDTDDSATATSSGGGSGGAAMAGSGGADDETQARMWAGTCGKLAREALSNLEDVAGERMDRLRAPGVGSRQKAEEAPGMAEMFLALSGAAVAVSSLAVDLNTVDLHVELAEQALDQASSFATIAASAKVKSSTSSANLITRVQLASGKSSLERLRHTFVLGCELDEDDFRSLMADMAMLATECRERAVKLKGSKAAAASTLGWEATKQLGDAKLLYASLLRLVWRKRRPKRRATDGSVSGGGGVAGRKLSQRAGSVETTIPEEEEVDDGSRRHSAVSNARSSVSANGSRKGSALDSVAEDEPIAQFHHSQRGSTTRMSTSSHSMLHSPGAHSRRGSWLPSHADGSPTNPTRTRRMSSMSAPLVAPDGTSAWNRKASIISLGAEEEAAGLVASSELAQSAWTLLEGAIKQYKLALSLLNNSDLPSPHLARAKAETLSQIAYAALFQASLATRVAQASEKRTAALVMAEVYSTWAAREVGWSFLIEGTKEAQVADRRTNSWRADEAGKRAVMLLVRTWWHRAVTTQSVDVETKIAAKDAVEVVVRRMRDREGVRDGDVVRWKMWLGRWEGEMDAAEVLFWRSVSRILRGGAGFVLS